MRMKNRILFLLLLGGVLLSPACSEPGLGGTASIKGHIEHHGDKIPNALVLIKYDAEELPGTQPSDYDDQTIASSTDGTYEFADLQEGPYYLYSMGYDSLIFDSVFGGIPIVLNKGEELETDIPVTE